MSTEAQIEYQREYRRKNRERLRSQKQEYGQKNKARIAARNKRYQEANPNAFRRNHLRREYGMSEDDYSRMLAKQHGVCAICKQPELKLWRGKPRPLAVDHNHITGKVRGLLCTDCNLALGFMQDDSQRLLDAASYVGPKS